MDISKGMCTCTMLENLPRNLQEYARSQEFVWWHIEPKAEDLEAIAALEPDLIVYEPSGGKYEKAFVSWFQARGIKCRKVAGRRLATYRAEAGLPKDDHFDSLAIAAYGLEKHQEPGALIPETIPEIEHLRSLWLQRHSLNRQRTGQIARLRQQLASEFPEAMEFSFPGGWGQDIPGLVLWLSGDRTSKHAKIWENRYTPGTIKRAGKKVELPGTIGTGISDYTRLVNQQLIEVLEAMQALENAIAKELAHERYKPYTDAMSSMDMSPGLQAVWLTRIYPFSKFMGPDGRERIHRRMSNNQKWCTHNQSLAQFKAALGAAIDIPRSGTSGGIAPTKQKTRFSRKKKGDALKVPIGCKYSRIVFWQWALLRIETGKAQGKLATQLIEKRHQLKVKERNIYQRAGNLHGYAAKLLYRELKKNILV